MFGQSAPQALRNTRMTITMMLLGLRCICAGQQREPAFERRKRPQTE
ncbi:MAG: hypothetical protein HHJ09_01255 [Glaciimonas sp.]|nr:hypothetical protein [Glaciimonas sp.]